MIKDSDARACIDKSWKAGRQSMLNEICDYLYKNNRGFILTDLDIQQLKKDIKI